MAVSRLNINGLANMSDPAVIEQMRRRYPFRKRRLPVTGENKQCLDGLGGLKDDLKGLGGADREDDPISDVTP